MPARLSGSGTGFGSVLLPNRHAAARLSIEWEVSEVRAGADFRSGPNDASRLSARRWSRRGNVERESVTDTPPVSF
ncbi:hypothetical protein GCM10007977_025640 [Dactylosporangium sucinum]|uniref:Uncharacterized protein n=1 Tax=Dactylosporangium sucinum TaxID=1424081 RepID=A0A917WRL4_9ACTN|nr:hypothetical protein GCM10007977_025640 [Dactylosporangium sucinum]